MNIDLSNSGLSDTYEDKMLTAFVGKYTKTMWYKKAFEKYNINGIDKFAWNWSWWGLFGNTAFLMYRKLYKQAFLIWFAYTIVYLPLTIYVQYEQNFIYMTIIGVLVLIYGVIMGGVSSYLIYHRYKSLKLTIENNVANEESRIQTMKTLGGVNVWAPWVFCIVTLAIAQGVTMLANQKLYTNGYPNQLVKKMVTNCEATGAPKQYCECVIGKFTTELNFETYNAATAFGNQEAINQLNTIQAKAINACR